MATTYPLEGSLIVFLRANLPILPNPFIPYLIIYKEVFVYTNIYYITRK